MPPPNSHSNNGKRPRSPLPRTPAHPAPARGRGPREGAGEVSDAESSATHLSAEAPDSSTMAWSGHGKAGCHSERRLGRLCEPSCSEATVFRPRLRPRRNSVQNDGLFFSDRHTTRQRTHCLGSFPSKKQNAPAFRPGRLRVYFLNEALSSASGSRRARRRRRRRQRTCGGRRGRRRDDLPADGLR